jgi:hypothetical protein
MPKQILLVYNPSARSQTHAEEWLGHFVSELTKDGEYLVTLYPTTPETTSHHLVPLTEAAPRSGHCRWWRRHNSRCPGRPWPKLNQTYRRP